MEGSVKRRGRPTRSGDVALLQVGAERKPAGAPGDITPSRERILQRGVSQGAE